MIMREGRTGEGKGKVRRIAHSLHEDDGDLKVFFKSKNCLFIVQVD